MGTDRRRRTGASRRETCLVHLASADLVAVHSGCMGGCKVRRFVLRSSRPGIGSTFLAWISRAAKTAKDPDRETLIEIRFYIENGGPQVLGFAPLDMHSNA